MKIIYRLSGFLILCFCACDVVEKKDLELITEPKQEKVAKIDSVELLDSVPHVKIGVQVWMSNNVSAITFSDGREIKKVKSIKDWNKYNERKMPCCYVMKNGDVLYNGYVLLDSVSVCPKGYRLPIADDYLMLAAYLGGREKFTEKVMTKLAKYDWSVEDWNEAEQSLYSRKVVSNNQSGFGANKGGYLFNGDLAEGACSFFWVNTPTDSTNTELKALYIGNCQSDMEQGIGNFVLENGFSIRCIRK
jgi:uncharacterized protein (TIGR02145 family)